MISSASWDRSHGTSPDGQPGYTSGWTTWVPPPRWTTWVLPPPLPRGIRWKGEPGLEGLLEGPRREGSNPTPPLTPTPPPPPEGPDG